MPLRRPRKRWLINPKTRVHDSQKRYSRTRHKQAVRRELRDVDSSGGAAPAAGSA